MKHMYTTISIAVCFFISFNITAQVTKVAPTGLINPIGIAKNGNDLFITSVGNASIRKKDLSDTSTTATTEFLPNISLGAFILMIGNELYIPSLGENRVMKIDVTNPTATLTNVVTNISLPMGLAVRNNELYISSRTDGKVVKVDITQTNPTPVDVITQLSGFVNGIAFKGDELYITHGSTISKINVTDAVPTLTEVIAGIDAVNVAFDGDFLYITQATDGIVSRVNTSQATLVVEDFLTLEEDPWGILIDGNTLYISEQRNARVFSFDLTTLGVDEASARKFTYYPNPTKDVLNITGLKNNTPYVLSDQHGREIKKGNFDTTDQLDISKLSNGIYFLKLDNYEVKKIMKY